MLNFSPDFETFLEVEEVEVDQPPTVLILDPLVPVPAPAPAPVPVLDQAQEEVSILEVSILETPLEVFLEVAEGSQMMEPKNLLLLLVFVNFCPVLIEFFTYDLICSSDDFTNILTLRNQEIKCCYLHSQYITIKKK